MHVRLYRFRQTHGIFKKRRVAASHESKQGHLILFVCTDRTHHPPTPSHSLPPTANRLLIAITSSHLVILFGQSVSVVYSYLHAPPLHFQTNHSPDTLDSLRTDKYPEIFNQATSHCEHCRIAFHNKNQLTFQEPLAGHCSFAHCSKCASFPSATFAHPFADGQHRSAWSHRHRKHVSRACDFYW